MRIPGHRSARHLIILVAVLGPALAGASSLLAAPPPKAIDAHRILATRRVTVHFDATPMREVVRHLRAVSGVRLVAHLDRERPRRGPDGIDPETPITLAAHRRPFIEVLEAVLEQCDEPGGCTWQIRRGILEIGRRERLARRRDVRLYPIDDLLVDPPDFDEAPPFDLDAALAQGHPGGAGGDPGLIGEPGPDVERTPVADPGTRLVDAIRATIEPDAWAANGGTWASIRLHPGRPVVLVVRAPPFVHRQIAGR